MSKIVHVFAKEMRDGLRDRRSALTALLFMPLGLPLMMIMIMNFALQFNVPKGNEPLNIYIIGAEIAPSLISYIEQNNAIVHKLDMEEPLLQESVKVGRYDFIVYLPSQYAESFLNGTPANIQIVSDSSNSRKMKNVYRVRTLLQHYNQKIALQRLQLQGISQQLLSPLAIEEIDVATPGGRAFMFLLSIPYILFMLTMIGGMHMANDLNAGERERASLEPLLILPVDRSVVAAGKCLATFVFMMIALLLSIVTYVLCVRMLDMESIGLPVNVLTPGTGLNIGLVLTPFAVFSAVLFNLVSSYTRSYKEAQTFLTIALMVPVFPILLISLYSLEISAWLMLIPSLGQGLIVTALIKGKQIEPSMVLLSIMATLIASAVLFALLVHRYRQDRIIN